MTNLLDVPAGDHRQEAQHRRQQDQRHADAVDAEVVVDVEAGIHGRAGDPVVALDWSVASAAASMSLGAGVERRCVAVSRLRATLWRSTTSLVKSMNMHRLERRA